MKNKTKHKCPGCAHTVLSKHPVWCACDPAVAPYRMVPVTFWDVTDSLLRKPKKAKVEINLADCGEVQWDRAHDTGNSVYTGSIHVTQDGKKTLCNKPIPKDDIGSTSPLSSWKWSVDWGKGSKRFAKEFGGSDLSKTGFVESPHVKYNGVCSCCSKRSEGIFDDRPARW